MRPSERPRRTALYLPASNAKAVAKSRSLDVDMVILDLEDAVGPDEKAGARLAASEAVRAGGFGHRELLVRVNGLDTPWGKDDLATVSRLDVDGVLVPKISSGMDIARYEDALADAAPTVAIWAMIETCSAISEIGTIARAAQETRLAGLVMGTNDLASEMRARITADRLAFIPALALSVAAARSRHLAILDGVCNDFADLNRFENECVQGLTLGFDGKTIIHPKQIDICNRVFGPGDEEIAWSDAVIAAFADPRNSGKGVVSIDGRMAELLHLDVARRVRAYVDALDKRVPPEAKTR